MIIEIRMELEIGAALNAGKRNEGTMMMTMTTNTATTIGARAATGGSVDSATASNDVQQWVKRSMAAITRLMAGSKDDSRGHAFNSQALVIVGGSLSASGLLWLADVSRLNRKHVIHLSPSPNNTLPDVALAYCRGEIVNVFESCMLCMMPDQDRVLMVPDSFMAGAYGFTSDFKLKRRRAPSSFNAAMPHMKRAYESYFEIFSEGPDASWCPLPIGKTR